MAEHKRRHGHPLQPKMFSSCDALPYHWNPTSMAERVGLPPCNGSTTLNNLPHRFFSATYLPSFKSCGDGGGGGGGGGEATGGDVSLAVVVTSLHVGGLWTCGRSSSDPG